LSSLFHFFVFEQVSFESVVAVVENILDLSLLIDLSWNFSLVDIQFFVISWNFYLIIIDLF